MITINYHKELLTSHAKTLLITSEKIKKQLIVFAKKIESIAITIVKNRISNEIISFHLTKFIKSNVATINSIFLSIIVTIISNVTF